MKEPLTHTEKQTTPLRSAFLMSVLFVATGAGIGLRGWAAEGAHVVPAPVVDEQAPAGAPAATSEIAVLAGGCFWGVQGVFQHVNGVTNAFSSWASSGALARPLRLRLSSKARQSWRLSRVPSVSWSVNAPG